MARKYIFTNKEYSTKGIMSTILGVISLVSLFYAVYLTYENAGEALPRYGAVVFLISVFSFSGLIVGIISKSEPDKFYLFTYVGIVLNILALAGVSLILFAGAYGI